MATKKSQLLYRAEIDSKVVTLSVKSGVFELELVLPQIRIATTLVDPTYVNPIQHARRQS